MLQGIALLWAWRSRPLRQPHLRRRLWEHLGTRGRARARLVATAVTLAFLAPLGLDGVGEGRRHRHAGHDGPAPAAVAFLAVASVAPPWPRCSPRCGRLRVARREDSLAPPPIERRRRPRVDRDLVALLGFVGMFALMALRVPIGIAMGIAGVCGFGALSS
jgi:hypothetical protein